MDFRRTANCVLIVCLSPGGRFIPRTRRLGCDGVLGGCQG
jgi:hypothetical protein